MNTFNDKKYIQYNNLLDLEFCEVVSQYALFDELQNFNPDAQVPSAHSKYADPLMETILLKILPAIEDLTELSLEPTYSYYRVYRQGSILNPHKDREACEISATICFGYNDYIWPIKMGEDEITIHKGGALVYKGCEIEHSRDVFQGNSNSWIVQGFFHYIDMYGKNINHIYDKRSSIGYPKKNIDYIEYLK